MQADGPALVALFVKAQGGLIAVLVEILHPEAASHAQPDPRIKKSFRNGAIAEVNQDKFGCVTPGTLIPIVSEEEASEIYPDYFLVLPWHF